MKLSVVLASVYTNPQTTTIRVLEYSIYGSNNRSPPSSVVVVGTRTTVLFINHSLTHSLIQIVDYDDDNDDEDCAGRR